MLNMEASEREQLLRIYAETRTIAVVGASADASKAAHQIPRYMQNQGYRILPVNPRGGELFGERVFRSLAEIDVHVDVVEVFRPAQEAPRDRTAGHSDRGKGALAPDGDRVGGGPADSRSSRADRRHELLYGRDSRAARSRTRTS